MSKHTKTKIETMEDLLEESDYEFPAMSKGDVVEGKVILMSRNEIWVDIPGFGTGVVVGRELQDNPNLTKDVSLGDALSASVIEPECEEGYTLLSLGKASWGQTWNVLKEKKEKKEIVIVKSFDANKGGLLIELDGIRGFLPVSQLAPKHYPRVPGADKDEILNRLLSLIDKPLEVVILDVDRREEKLIFSEKEAKKGEMSDTISKFKIGQKVEGEITGIVDFGIFLNVSGVEGLIHISEISWDKVNDPRDYVKIGEKVKALIIDSEDNRISLSLKQLAEDPWLVAIKDFKVRDIVSGKVTRVTPFGAFIAIHDAIEALVHISELSDKHVINPKDIVEEGKNYDFEIISIESGSRKLALSLKSVNSVNKEKSKDKKTKIKKVKVKGLESKESLKKKGLKTKIKKENKPKKKKKVSKKKKKEKK